MSSFNAIIAALLVVLACPGCDAVPDSNSGPRLQTLKGAVSRFSGKTVRIVVGAGDEQRPGEVSFTPKADGNAASFVVRDLPAGAKFVRVEIDGVRYSVKFPKSPGGPLSTIIPETNLVGDSFDLGELELDGNHAVASRNPFAALIDTDLDGVFDYNDDDIDGDGLMNGEDGDVYGDFAEYLGWDWDEEASDAWDEDNDGVCDWDDPDNADDEWAEAFDDADPFSDWGDYDYCDEFPEDESCYGACDPSSPDPACEAYCRENPGDLSCYASLEDFCAANPESFECATE